MDKGGDGGMDEGGDGGIAWTGGRAANFFELIDLRYCCLLLVRSIPFSPVRNCISPVRGMRLEFPLLSTVGSKAPYRSALFALNFSISSTSHARGSASTPASPSSFPSQESGSLKMFSAMALPGSPLKEVKGDIKGESRISRSG